MKRTHCLLLNYLFVLITGYPYVSFSQTTDNNQTPISASNITEEFHFAMSKNEMKQPVVTVESYEVANFLSFQDNTTFRYTQAHNKFVELKKFYLYTKKRSKYSLVSKDGNSVSATDENIFLDDNWISYHNINLNKGEEAKVETEFFFKDSKYLTRLFFHAPFPVKERILKFIVPDWLKVEFIEKNFRGAKIQKQQQKDGNNTIFTFTTTELEGLKKEDNDINIAYTHPHIIVLVHSFGKKEEVERGFQNTSDLYNWYNLLYKQCKNDVSSLNGLVNELTKGKTNNIDKIKSLFYWVQDNIRYIAFENGYAGFIPESVQNVLKNKYGDCKGMANLLTEMLALAGFDAHFTWIGTKHLPYDHATIPSLCVDNHAISTLYLNGREYFLDATEKYIPFGENADRIQGKSALIAKGESFDLKYVPISEPKTNKLSNKASLVLEKNNIKGHVKVELTGNEKTRFHQIYHSLPAEQKNTFLSYLLKFGNENLTVSELTTSNLGNRDIAVILEGKLDLSNNVTIVGKDIFATIDFFPKSLDRYRPDEKRQKGYDFERTFLYEDIIELNISENAKFVDVPEGVKLEFPNYSFVGSYTTVNNKIILEKKLSIRNNQIQKSDFSNWANFLRKLKEFNNNQISVTLTK